MRILHVVPSYLPAVRYGGPIYSVHALAKATARRGHETHVFTTNVDGAGVSPVPTGRPVDLDGVRVTYFPCGVGRRLYRSPAMARGLADNIRRFDVVHLHSVFLWPTLAAARAARKAGVPYVLAPRGMLVGDLIRRKSRWFKSAWISLFERDNIAAAAAAHVTSEVEKMEIVALGLCTKRFVVIPNGVDLPGATPEEIGLVPAGHPFVLSLGRINWKKGLDRLIQAMVHVPGADLVIVGNDEEGYRSRLEEIASGLGLAPRVRFVGPVHGEEKWALMRSAAVFALPSYSENFGNAVLEAMACGVPVVVTPEVGLAAEVAASGAGLVVDGAPERLGPAIAELLGNPRRRSAMGVAGREIAVEKFSWGGVAAQMEAVYRSVQTSSVDSA